MISKNIRWQISNHGLERAKQRFKLKEDIDKNSIMFQYQLIDIIKNNASFLYHEGRKLVFYLAYNNQSYKIIVNSINQQTYLIETIINI